VELLGRIDLTGVLNRAAQPSRSLADPGDQGSPPLTQGGPRDHDRNLLETPAKLSGVHPAEPVEHRFAASIAFSDHVGADVFERIPWDAGTARELIQNLYRDVHFADSAERLRDAPDLALGLLSDFRIRRQDGNRLPETPRRDPGLVHSHVVPGHGRGQLPLELACAA
jgi:hypothetical protein